MTVTSSWWPRSAGSERRLDRERRRCLGWQRALERGEAPDTEIREHGVRAAAEALAPLVKAHDVVITHGNGPQVGFLALESASDPVLSRPYPFDTLVAETRD